MNNTFSDIINTGASSGKYTVEELYPSDIVSEAVIMTPGGTKVVIQGVSADSKLDRFIVRDSYTATVFAEFSYTTEEDAKDQIISAIEDH